MMQVTAYVLQECFFVRILAFEYVGSMIPAYAWYISSLFQACICVQACSWHLLDPPKRLNLQTEYTPPAAVSYKARIYIRTRSFA